jgi:glycosyltransferase
VLLVTIVKNDLLGLKKTIESVANQDYESLYHFVVNGGNDLETVAYLEFMQSLYPSLSFVNEEDGGIYDAMNKWRIFDSDFDYLCWLNAGDYFNSSETVTNVLTLLKSSGAKWAYGNMEIVDSSGVTLSTHNQTPYRRRLLELGLRWIPHEASFISADIARTVDDYNVNIGVGADQEFLIRIASVAIPAVCNEIVVKIEAGGAHTSLRGMKREYEWHIFRKINNRLILNSQFCDLALLPILFCCHKFRLLSLIPFL